MTVQEFIDIVSKAKDIDIADIDFSIDEKSYQLESVGQFSIVPDVTVYLKEVEVPLMREVKHFRRDKADMINETMAKIAEDIKDGKI